MSGYVVLLVGVLALLYFVIFPWVEPRLPWNDVNVNSPSIEQTVPSSSPVPAGSPQVSPSTLPAG
jgi:hypothetical protein